MTHKKNSFLRLAVLLFFVFGLGAQFVHMPHSHEVCAHDALSIAEYCGGELDPCSREGHDHSSKSTVSHNCCLCYSSQFTPLVEKLEDSFFVTFVALGSFHNIEKVISSSKTNLSLGSRAPPFIS